jgi:GT2 family glycosyltransferase
MVGAAVASVLSQGFADFELIVVDDGSSDRTAAELAGFGSRIRCISTTNRGVSAARNAGVRASAGRYLAFLDSDDLWQAGKLARQTAFMEEQPQVQICQTEEIWVRNGVRVNPKSIHRKPSGDVFLRSLELCLVSPSAVMMARELFERLGGFDESFPVCEDYDLWLRISVQEPIPLIPVPLVVKRGGHADQLSHSMWGMDRYRVLALQKLLRAGIDDSRRAAVLNVLRRKVAVLANGARKRGKLVEAAGFEAMLAGFELGRTNGDECDSRLREGQKLSPADA